MSGESKRERRGTRPRWQSFSAILRQVPSKVISATKRFRRNRAKYIEHLAERGLIG
jgi:hypothetical protein